MIELPGWMWMACMFSGVAFAVALIVVSLTIFVWQGILPLLRDEW